VSGRDLGASVRQRLLNQSRLEGRPFQELLQYFAMERFLYRLSQSRFATQFILKGALLLTAWRAPISRRTMDIDLAGRSSNNLNHIRSFIVELCRDDTLQDGITFQTDSLDVGRIAEDADYEGVRARFQATLARARVPMQIDVGFGDVIVPDPTEVSYPTLLDFPAPVLRAYPKETVIAEKLEALTVLGLLNSRMKDYYDLALLARLYMFDGRSVVDAVLATFRNRETTIEAEPVGLTKVFTPIRRKPSSGKHSSAGAGSRKNRAAFKPWYRKSATSLQRLCRLRRSRNLSTPVGVPAGRGNEAFISPHSHSGLNKD